jgi:uncharacterized membrane protein YgcG
MISVLLNRERANRAVTVGSLVIAFAIASVFFKFGSFALECLAFLATWTLIDLPAQWFATIFGNRASRDSS